MRNRTIKMQVWLNRQEAAALKRKAKKCRLSQAAYVRSLLAGYVPRETPPLEYHSLIRQLRVIGNNINQIATVANAIGIVDGAAFKQEAEKLYRVILTIQQAVLTPDRI